MPSSRDESQGLETISSWSRREADRQQANTSAHMVDMRFLLSQLRTGRHGAPT
jgi:hypothetical protein